MTRTGLEIFVRGVPRQLTGKKIGVVCHAASTTASFVHIIDALQARSDCTLAAVFGPQHGLFGQTQDNMIEWEGEGRSQYRVPVYSLYGAVRKPTRAMLDGIDALVFDLQDVGARPYTYLWTLKLCMEACGAFGKPLFVLDRPNPVAALGFDGPLLQPAYFSFVGGAEIPLCYRLTIGELAVLFSRTCCKNAELTVVWMEGWRRNSLYGETGLPWILPSPNMPTPDTALVYPGMVLLEATTLSEGRGTTRPFEIFGAPALDIGKFMEHLGACRLRGCVFREHEFIPTFQKWAGKPCRGMQIHVTEPRIFRPVETAAAVLMASRYAAPEIFGFRTDPYEYEREKPAIDILSGSDSLRKAVMAGATLDDLRREWKADSARFLETFHSVAHYPEELQ